MADITYIQGAELPDVRITWRDEDNSVIDFSSGWTFTVRIGQMGQAATIQKTTGITGSSGSGNSANIVISWSNTELETLPVNTYFMQVVARLTATGKDRKMSTTFEILPQVLAP